MRYDRVISKTSYWNFSPFSNAFLSTFQQKFLVIASSSSEIHAACDRPLLKLRKFRTLSTLQFFERPGMCWITQLLQYDSKVLLSLYYPRPSWAHTEFTAGIGMSCEMGFGSTNHVMGVPPYTNLDSWNMQKVLALRKATVLILIVSHTNTYTISNTFFVRAPFWVLGYDEVAIHIESTFFSSDGKTFNCPAELPKQ